jgi:crossover junction endodeoxyribonuclease RuvC
VNPKSGSGPAVAIEQRHGSGPDVSWAGDDGTITTLSLGQTVLGIDLGLHGAVARLTLAGELLGVFDAPTLRDGAKGRESINPPLMAQLIADCHAARAYVEFVGPRPHEGPLGAFSFGRALGVTVGICAAYAIPVSFITAPVWKRLVGIAPGAAGAKDAARSEAVRRWPAHASLFARVRDDGRAEACLIALAGLKRERRNV